MTITALTNDTLKAYDDYVISHSKSVFNYSSKYKKFLEKYFKAQSHYLISLNYNKINGAFPLMSKNGVLGTIWNALPFYGSHGSMLADSPEIECALFQHAHDNYFTDAAGWTIITRPNQRKNFIPDHSFTDQRVGQWTRLEKDQETLWSSFDSSTRRNIRKAEKENIAVEIDNTAWDFLETVHIQNMKDIGGKAKPSHFFSTVQDIFKAGKDYNIYVAYHNDIKIAALLIFYFKDTVEYFTPATINQYRNTQPSAAIINKAMIDAAQKGYKWWNWGGTWPSQEGVYKFKSKWGAQDFPYHYYTTIENKDILSATKEQLIDEYDNFFVIPFDQLESEKSS